MSGNSRRVSCFVMVAAIALAMIADAAPARAQSHGPSERELVRLKQQATSELWVYRDSEPIHGFLTKLTNSEITLLNEDQQEQTIPLDSVWRIERSGDTVWDGFAIGAAVGAVGFIVLTRPEMSRSSKADMFAGFVYTAGVSGLIGAGIDALHVGRTRIYDVPRRTERRAIVAPTLDGRGAMLSWSVRF